MKSLNLIASLCFVLPSLSIAESYQAKALRTLVSDPKFSAYVTKNEQANNVHLSGIRIPDSWASSPDGKFFWNLDFEGGVNPAFAKIVCLGSARSNEKSAEFPDYPADCSVIRFTE